MEFAKYVGLADQRQMLERDWVAAGVPNQGSVSWDRTNGFAVPRNRFSDDAWALLATDPGIVFTGERPRADETAEAAVNAARSRLMARQAGNAEVLHAQDPIPTSGD